MDNSDPTGRETLIEVTFVQGLNKALEAAEFISKGVVICNQAEKLQAVTGIIFWGSIAATALAETVASQLNPGKSAFSIYGYNYNPVPLSPSRTIRGLEIRGEYDVTPAVKFALTYVGVSREDVTIKFPPGGGVSITGAWGLNSRAFPICTKCGINTGDVSLKFRVKETIDITDKTDAAGGVAFAAELNLLFGAFRQEFPLFEFGYSLQKGGYKKVRGR